MPLPFPQIFSIFDFWQWEAVQGEGVYIWQIGINFAKTSDMIKVKVIEGNWYSVRLGENAYEGRCDFTYCIYVFGILVYVKFYKDLSFNQSKIIFKGCEVINSEGKPTKY